MATISLPYKTIRVMIGLNGVKKYDPKRVLDPAVFVMDTDSRDERRGKTKKLIGALDNGEAFAGVWLVNLKGSKLRMIDCNHRYRATVNYLTRNPSNKVQIELHLFQNLTPEQERIEFRKANAVTGQNTKDYVKQYRSDMNIYQYMQKQAAAGNFPVNINYCDTGKAIAFHTLMSPYMTRGEIPYQGGFNGSAMDMIDICRSWNQGAKNLNSDGMDAYNTIREFLRDFIAVFDGYSKKNPYWRPAPLFMLFRLWYDNKQIPVASLQNNLKRLTTNVHKEIVKEQASRGANRTACQEGIRTFLRLINNGRKRNNLSIRDQDPGTKKEVRIYG